MLDGEKLWSKGFFWGDPFCNVGLSRQVSVVDEVCREAAFERTDLNRGKKPKTTSGKWTLMGFALGLPWIFYDFLLLVQSSKQPVFSDDEKTYFPM